MKIIMEAKLYINWRSASFEFENDLKTVVDIRHEFFLIYKQMKTALTYSIKNRYTLAINIMLTEELALSIGEIICIH